MSPLRAAGLLILALATPALATLARADDSGGRIRVIGRATSETVPDFASVEVGVGTKGGTPAAALDAASAAAKGIIALARELGVPEADIGTTSIMLEPAIRQIRQPDGTFREQSDGYTAGNRVRVRLGDMARLGELLRRSLEAGANRIEGVAFGLRDPAAAEAAVQVAAMNDARAQAERLAGAAGLTLGPAVSITAPPRADEPRPMRLAAAKAAPRGRAPVPVVAGTIETGAEVEAVFVTAR